MTPDEQIAAIRERLAAGDYRLTQVPEIHTLLNRIDELTAERDEAEANIGEVNQLLADTLSRTKSAEQRAEDAARVERDAVVKWLRARADGIAMVNRECGGDYRLAAQANVIDEAADAIERGEHEKGGGDG